MSTTMPSSAPQIPSPELLGVAALTAAVTGPVLLPADPGWANELVGFNLAVSHDPDVVVGATCAADVRAAVDWARGRGLPVAVLATGHGWSAPIGGGVAVTTRRMQDLALDTATGRLRVGAGVRWRAVLDAAAGSVWAAPCGSSSGVGVVGYTLGGGLPVLGRTIGFAADRVRAIEVVTADGRLRTVTADSDSDLFHALCGGGGNLGVVTALEMDLPPVPRLTGGGLFFAGESAEEVVAAWASWSRDLPETMNTSIALLRLPPMPELPEPLRGRFVVHVRVAFAGVPAAAEALLAPLRELTAPLVLDTVGELPYAALDAVHMDPHQPVPLRHGGVLLAELTGAAVGRLLELAGPGADCPLLLVELRRLGGALARDAGSPVVNGRRSAYSLHAIGMLVPPVAAQVPAGLRAVLDGMAPWSGGATLLNLHGNPTDTPDDAERARAWDPGALDTLLAAKAAVDPDDMFRLGHTLPARP